MGLLPLPFHQLQYVITSHLRESLVLLQNISDFRRHIGYPCILKANTRVHVRTVNSLRMKLKLWSKMHVKYFENKFKSRIGNTSLQRLFIHWLLLPVQLRMLYAVPLPHRVLIAMCNAQPVDGERQTNTSTVLLMIMMITRHEKARRIEANELLTEYFFVCVSVCVFEWNTRWNDRLYTNSEITQGHDWLQ